MNAARHLPLRKVMIPWVITLVALFGWNAFSPEHARTRKGDVMEGVGISQIADEPELPGPVGSPMVFVSSSSGSLDRKDDPAWSLVLIPKDRPSQPGHPSARTVHGRAPPCGSARLMA